MTTVYSGDGITFPDASVQATAPRVGMVNRVINGDMRINQRYGTTLQTGASGYVTDRFQVINSSAGTVNVQTVATAPAGFTYSTQLTVGTADTSVGSNDSVLFYQTLEGYNIADLNWAGANAKSITLSFWVYSSLIGTYSGSLVDAGGAVSHPFNYTISTANTWTKITQVVEGPVIGTFGSTNGVGFYLEFSLMTGSSLQGTPNAWAAGNFRGTASQINWMATSGNTWLITGVQLEKGSTATDFDYRQYGTELVLCQRYYEVLYASSTGFENMGYYSLTGSYRSSWPYKAQKRATASVALGSVASWGGATPTIYEGISTSGFYHASTCFYAAATAGTIALQASAEL
tara:strand:- start:342 stop:1379 length:1038 start_codon:yes stop_codon:yes gene_type:complete